MPLVYPFWSKCIQICSRTIQRGTWKQGQTQWNSSGCTTPAGIATRVATPWSTRAQDNAGTRLACLRLHERLHLHQPLHLHQCLHLHERLHLHQQQRLRQQGLVLHVRHNSHRGRRNKL
jgi:hypothetical protein